MSRFFVEGIEIEITDPTFYQSTKEVDQLIHDLSEYLNDYS